MRVALTGGATGIGAEVAKMLAEEGHEVTAFDIREPSGVAHWVETDLSDPASIKAATDAASGSFDALINNAGVPPRPGQQEIVLRVNYFGLAAFLEGMLDKLAPGASIVNTASRAGAHWRENLTEVRALMALSPEALGQFIAAREIDHARAYNLSKEAVIVMNITWIEALLRRDLRMNSVSPAAVSTGILDDFAAAFGDRMAKNVARVGRPGTPEEIARTIVFLASPQSHWIKGQDIVMDGGMSALSMRDAWGLDPVAGI